MKTAIRTKKAPLPAAAYSQAVVSGALIFVSGQVATNPSTGVIDAITIENQVTQVLRNIEAIVCAAGGSRESIVRCGVFLADLGDFAAMNRSYEEFFGDTLPARTTVQAGLGAFRVEIDAIAARSNSQGKRPIAKGKRKPRKQSS